MIEHVSQAFDAGQVTAEHVEQMLALVYPDSEAERAERRERVMPGGKIVKFQLVALNKQAAQVIKESNRQPTKPAEPEIPAEFLADVPDEVVEHTGPDYAKEIKARYGILEIVRKFGKPQGEIRVGNRTENIMVRCPFPHHEDKDPSTWINTEDNVWNCGKCVAGGDVIDFYAARKGLEKREFHHTPEFRTITKEMAAELGIEVEQVIDASSWTEEVPDTEEDVEPTPLDDEEFPVEDVAREADPPKPVVPPSAEADEPITVTTDEVLRGIEFQDDDSDEDNLPPQWQIAVPRYEVSRLNLKSGTFLESWLRQHREELGWLPHEYMMMLGLQAIGLASGHHIVSRIARRHVNGALMMVLIGPSGYGKSTAAGRLTDMLNNVPGPAFDYQMGTGVRMLPSLSSAEAFSKEMRTEIEDPVDPTKKMEVPTTALLYEDEFATFVEKTRRKGGGHLKQRLMGVYDFVKTRPDPEKSVNEVSLGTGQRVVHDSYLAALFLTQTQSIRMLAERNDLVSGFLNRIVPVFGVQRERENVLDDADLDPHPAYFDLYEQLWRKCREDCTIGNPIILPFSDAARVVADSHSFFAKAKQLEENDSIYARLVHLTRRFALLLAINEYTPDLVHRGASFDGLAVEERHLLTAIDLVNHFIRPGYQALVEAISADDVDELANKIYEFIESYYNRKGVWPDVGTVLTAPFQKKFASNVRPKALEQLKFTKQVVDVKLKPANSENKREILVATSGPHWSRFRDSAGKTFTSESFYANSNNVKNK